MSGRLVFDQNNNIKLPNDKANKRRKRIGRSLLFILSFIAVCAVISISSCAVTYNWLGIGWVGFTPSGTANETLDDNELLTQNEELREQVGIMQAQIDQLEAQLEQALAQRGNLPAGTGVTTTPQPTQPTTPAETTPPAGTGTGTGTTPGTGAGTGTGTTPGTGTGTGTGTTPGTGTETPPTGGIDTTPPPPAGDDTVARPPAESNETVAP